jgi:SpoVK/Ycf46/Vps4 family AAA+-type ATPase
MNKQKEVSTIKRIEYLIRARYPLIYVVSSEENRVENTLQQIASERNKKLFFWSITKGMESNDGTNNPDLREPIKALDHIAESTVNGIFILRDFHPYLNDPVVIRNLRDLNRTLKTQLKNIIFLSSVLNIPAEVEKEIAIIDFDLPTREVLNTIVESVLRSVENPPNIEIFNDEKKREKIIEAALGLTSEESENVFARSLVESNQFNVDIILSEKEQIIRKSGVLEFYKTSEEISDVGGLEHLKTWLQKRTRAFTKEAREFGLPQPKGILLVGIPGCGKSLTAKAISSLWQLPLLRLDVGKVFSSLVGSSEENVRKAIQTAESIAPSILWLDELEKGFAGIQSSGSSDAGTTARVFGTFITWLQEKTSPVFVVSTANNVSMLPPELLRKGRFDEIFYIDLPTFEERKDIFKIHLEKRKRNPSLFDVDMLAHKTKGYSGAEIEQIIISALYDAFDSNEEISDERLTVSTDELIPLSQTMSEDIAKIREWSKIRARKASYSTFTDEEDLSRKLEME